MEESESCRVGQHELCNSKSCNCGCHSKLIRSPDEEIEEDRSDMEGMPGP